MYLVKIIGFSILGVLFSTLVNNCSSLTDSEQTEDCNLLDYIDTTRSYYYNYFDEKIYLDLYTDLFFVRYDSTIDYISAKENFSKYKITEIRKITSINSYILKAPEGRRAEEFYTFYGTNIECGFASQDIIVYSTPVFWYSDRNSDTSFTLITDEFIVDIDTTKHSFEDFMKINQKYSVELTQVREYFENSFILRVTKKSPLNALDMANMYQDSAYAKLSSPDFRLIGRFLPF